MRSTILMNDSNDSTMNIKFQKFFDSSLIHIFRCTATALQNMSSAVLEELCCVFTSLDF